MYGDILKFCRVSLEEKRPHILWNAMSISNTEAGISYAETHIDFATFPSYWIAYGDFHFTKIIGTKLHN